MPEATELSGFYGRQALRCRLLAQHATGTQAVAINSLAEKYERAAAELRTDHLASAGW